MFWLHDIMKTFFLSDQNKEPWLAPHLSEPSRTPAHKKSSVLVLTPKDMYHVLNFNVLHVHIEMSAPPC